MSAVLSTPEFVRSAWSANPVGFVSDKLGANPWSKQIEILEAVRDHSRVAVRSCNGSGKTYIAAYVVLWWLMCHVDAVVITTAPTGHQVKDILWREIRRAYTENQSLIGGNLLRVSLELGPKHFAKGLSTDMPERFQGFHEGHILFVVDEASGVREGIFEAIEGSLTSADAKVLLLGNPTSLRGTFYEAFHKRRGLWKTIHISAFDTPNLQQDDIAVPSLVTPKWVADAETNWGTESYLYQVRVLGEFPSESEDTLIPLKLIEQAVGVGVLGRACEAHLGPVYEAPRGTPGQGNSVEGRAHSECLGADMKLRGARQGDDGDIASAEDGLIEVGVDVARFGSDKTAICVRRGVEIISLETFTRQDTMSTAGQVVRVSRKYSPSAIRIDEIGIGAGVVDRLRELKTPHVEGVNVARRASKSEHFSNLRAELFDGLRERFQDRRISIPGDAELISQLASIRYSFTSSGQMRIEDKDDLRARGERSPDLADAVMLAFARRPERGYRFWS